jgi:hypothetical protein
MAKRMHYWPIIGEECGCQAVQFGFFTNPFGLYLAIRWKGNWKRWCWQNV